MFAILVVAALIIFGLTGLLLYIVKEKKKADGLTKVLVVTGNQGVDLEMREQT